MDIEHSIKNTRKYAILEVMFFNGFSVGMQSFVLLSLALYFNMSSFLISVVSSLPTAGYLLQIFTKRLNTILGSRKRTLVIAVTISRLAICMLPFAVLFDIKKQGIYFAIMFIYGLSSPFVNNVWTATMVEIINKKERGKYFGKRNLFSSLSTVIYTLFYGYILSLPDKKNSILLLTTVMSMSAIGSAIFMYLHYVPDLGEEINNVSIKTAFKNKNFVLYLKFASVWLFTWEFLKPLTEYYRIKILGVNTMFLSQMGVLTAILSSVLYIIYGKLSDKYGNKTMLRMGIFFTTYYVLTYFSMTKDNKMSMLFAAAVIDAVGFTAITLSLLNLMMEVSEEPADAYVGAYAIVCGIAAILAGIFGGLVGKFINNGVIYIFGEEFYTIRFAFAIGFVLRLFSLLELTRVDSFEKTFIYKGSLPIKNFFSKRILNVGASYINDMKKSERESKNIKTENKENDKNIDNSEVKGVKKETENQKNKTDKIENSEKRTEENNIDKTV